MLVNMLSQRFMSIKTRIFFIVGIFIFIFSSEFLFSGNQQKDEFKELNPQELTEIQKENEEFDEFKPLEVDADNDDEFSEFKDFNEDEFNEADTNLGSIFNGSIKIKECQRNEEFFNSSLLWVIGILLFTILAGFLVRFKTTRNLRGLSLLIALIFLGFYKGGCTCHIMSFEKSIIWLVGVDIDWRHLIWFLGLIPITYFFGKVWCGWVCHLGALQEFIFKPVKFEIFKGTKAQKTMIIIRYIFIATLITQLLITNTNIFCKYDPFKVVFNLFSVKTLSWWLLGLLLISSVFINRPFCRTICPIGIILGWVGKIPGASIIGLKGKCVSCKQCSDSCDIHAITRNDKKKISTLDTKECITCGNCISACKQSGITFVHKSKKHANKIDFKIQDFSDPSCSN